MKKVMKKVTFIVLAIAFIIVQAIIPMAYQVTGISMNPTLEDGAWVLIDYYGFEDEYKYNDIIVFEQSGHKLIKRIIGVEGDYIQIVNNELFINGEQIKEDYILEAMNTKDLDFIVPKDSIFVLGDNRNESVDSRVLGLINKDDIIGKLLYIL